MKYVTLYAVSIDSSSIGVTKMIVLVDCSDLALVDFKDHMASVGNFQHAKHTKTS